MVCFVYIDDVVIFAGDIQEHHEKLAEVFERLRVHNLKLNPDKCQFLKKEIIYLRHTCSEKAVETNQQLINKIQQLSTPTKSKQVQNFLGAANY